MNEGPLLPSEPWPQRISRLAAWFAGALILVGCGALISIDVVTRFVFKRGMVESFELSGYALAMAVGLGLAFTVTSKANVRVDILLDALPARFRVLADIVASFSLAAIALALAWFCWKTLAQSVQMNARSVSVLQVPMAAPQSVWWIGIAWFAAMAVLVPVQAMLRLITRDRAGFDALVGSLRVKEEIEQAGAGAAVKDAP